MNNIPPPNSFDNSNFHSPYRAYSLREAGPDPYGDLSGAGNDPSGNNGLEGYGDLSGSGQSTALQQYAYDRQLALQTLQNGNLDPESRQAWENYLNVTLPQWFQKYGSAAESLGGISGSDLSNGMGASLNGAAINNLQLGEMIWQDQTRAKWDGSDPVTYTVNQQSDTRQQDFFQSDVTLQIPYRGAVAHTQLVSDDSVQGAKMLQVTVSMPDGSSRIINVHDVTVDSNIQILASDPDNVTKNLDASLTSDPLASQVTVSDINSANASSQPQGDSPTTRKDGKLGWVGDSFNIYSTEDGKDKYISARGAVGFHASSKNEYWTVEWDNTNSRYIAKVYNDKDHTHLKETFYMNDMPNLNATFDIDPSHILFKGELGQAGADSNDLNTSNVHAQKLSFGTGDSSTNNTQLPNDATPYDDAPDNTAIWKTWKDVNAYAKDGFEDHDITAPGQVTIHGFSFSDKMSIDHYDPTTHDWTITVYKSGITDPTKPGYATEKFHVHGGENSPPPILDVMDPSYIVSVDSNGKVILDSNGNPTPETDQTNLGSVQIGSSGQAGSNSGAGIDTSNDTQPTDKNNGTWTYTPKDGKVDVNATFDHKDNKITATGDVTIHIADSQTATLAKESGDYLLTVTDPKTKKQVTYHINENAQTVNIDGNELNVDLDKDCLFDSKIKVQGKLASQTIAAKSYLSTEISLGAGAIQDDNLKWKNVNDQDFYQKAMGLVEKFVQDIAAALKSKDWSKVDADFSKMNDLTGPMSSGGYETVFRALRGVLSLDGSNVENKLKGVFAQMPSDIRKKFVDGLKTVGSDNMKVKDSDIFQGAWIDDQNQEPDWTLQNSVDFIQNVDTEDSTSNP